MLQFRLIVAATQKGGIGFQGALPWPKLPGDMEFFRRTTVEAKDGKQNAVIMGRKTWDSIPLKFRPLRDRINIVVTRQLGPLAADSVHVASSLERALEFVATESKVDQVFVIGGSEVFAEAMKLPHQCERIHLTQILKDFNFDVAFPAIDPAIFKLETVGPVQQDADVPYQFLTYHRRSHASAREEDNKKEVPRPMPNRAEQQYLDLVHEIIEHGNRHGDRTGVGTLSKFGVQMRFSLRDHEFPLLTTKKVFFRAVIEELLWMIRGSTDSKELAEKKIYIWDANGSREFLDQLGFSHREVGDLGPVYGFQWRHFGAEYKDCKSDYSSQGVDQLLEVVRLLKQDPTSRRIILCAWNATDIPKMALPPCHCLAQFYVHDKKLSCQLYQRSGDMGLGVPFNIASYAALTCMLAHCCGLEPWEFVHTIGDAHVYLNHVEALKKQIERQPRPFPKLVIKGDAKLPTEMQLSDFHLADYHPLEAIPMKMAV